jgi:hypothetical protein
MWPRITAFRASARPARLAAVNLPCTSGGSVFQYSRSPAFQLAGAGKLGIDRRQRGPQARAARFR